MLNNVIAEMKKVLFLCSVVTLLLSCENKFDKTMSFAGDNAAELQAVLDHYGSDESDSLKLRAAEFLISNMAGHGTRRSAAIDSFARMVAMNDTVAGKYELNDWWKAVKDLQGDVYVEQDASALTAGFLIDNIDGAFRAWEQAPWRGQVDFATFCEAVLPYRFSEEPLAVRWRDTLRARYFPLVETERDPRRAFAIIYNAVTAMMPPQGLDFPYFVSAVDMEKVRRGRCIQRCVYIGSIMRAVGLPVVVDGVERWANYSTKGHNWLALVLPSGTYTLAEGDSIARRGNAINSSLFPMKNSVEQGFPYGCDFKKRCAKVYRNTFAMQGKSFGDGNADPHTRSRFLQPFSRDVTQAYTSGVDVTLAGSHEYAYLCIFTMDKGWLPVEQARCNGGKYTFRCMGDSVVYHLAAFEGGKLRLLGHPFVALRGGIRVLSPNLAKRRRVSVDRKYPLIGKIIDGWAEWRGSRFEASNDKDFRNPALLHVVDGTPLYRNEAVMPQGARYRYVRFSAPETSAPQVAEVEVHGRDSVIKGTAYGEGKYDYRRAYDGDPLSSMIRREPGFSFGIDLGARQEISRIVYFAANDGNFVVPGDEYELFYHDGGWQTLGRVKSDGYRLTFDNVPEDALLILRNHSKGSEERPFIYEHGRQVWW